MLGKNDWFLLLTIFKVGAPPGVPAVADPCAQRKIPNDSPDHPQLLTEASGRPSAWLVQTQVLIRCII